MKFRVADHAVHRAASLQRCVAAISLLTATACAAEVASEDDLEVAATEQELAGLGQTFWIPPRGEKTTTLYYCFENEGQMLYGGDAVEDALADTWAKYANIRFVREGACSQASHASQAIRIRGWDDPKGEVVAFGKELAGVVNGMNLPRNAATLQGLCGPQFPTATCFDIDVTHEFGHALGFLHEHARPDWVHFRPDGTYNCVDQGIGALLHTGIVQETQPNTLLTSYDGNSILDSGYCAPLHTGIHDTDIAGVTAIYGRNCQEGCGYVYYGQQYQHAIRFQANANWMRPASDLSVTFKNHIGTFERITFTRVTGSDDRMRYGDVVAVRDRWGHFMSGRKTPVDEVLMDANMLEWERWQVETMDASRYPTGSLVEINAPLRLRSVRWNKWLGIKSTGDDVILTTAVNSSQLRINGPLFTL